ncbi:MAG TPA: methylmalonyl-CoA mutase family protein [Bacteroidales bacterium]|nr:methylmalonyl-CoA mutase family protein [Bacteroidales bacterium]
MVKKEKLFSHFPPVTTKEWMDKIHTDLRGADFTEKLVWKTDEGFEVNPFYRMEDIEELMFINGLPGEFPYVRGTKTKNNNWHVRQNIEVVNYSGANHKALTILMKGVDSLGFIIADPESVNEKNFNTLLNNIHIENIELNFLCNGKAKEILDLIKKIVIGRGLDQGEVRGAIEVDPISRLMINGKLCVPVESGFDYLASLTGSSSALPNLKTVHLNASNFSNAGADIVQELAFTISSGKEYLVQLTERGLSAEIATSKIRFSFGIGSNYFMEIAKLRAARLLWSVVTHGFNTEMSKVVNMEIHCVTTEWNKTVYDPYVNMLRTQTEAMSAILGGTDSLTVQPFDTSFRQPDEFSERIARNQQLILKEESYFDKVADPAAGSYYIENLTNIIADSSWKLFLEIEDQGGYLETLKSGFIQKKISESAAKRKNQLAIRKKVLLGTNKFPNTEEAVSNSVDLNRLFGKMSYEEDLFVDPILLFRGSEEYDKLRIAVDKSPKRPSVFLFPVGDLAMRKARSQFSANFFGCAGYHIIDNNGFDTIDEGVESALEEEADIVVICSSDEEYLLFAPDIYRRLKSKVILVVAGTPASIDELKSKGLDMFINVHSNVPETIGRLNTRLGINL